MNISDTGSSFELPPAGVHAVRCFRLIDLGTQVANWQGKETRQRKVSMAWELGHELMSDGRPFIIVRRFTASLSDKSALRALLKSWRGRDFTPEELKGFNLDTVVGAFGLANIVHESRDGNTFANLASLMPLPSAMPKFGPVNRNLIFDLSTPDDDAWERLSSRMQEVILASPEGHAWMNGTHTPTANTDPPGDLPDDEFDDDIPF